MNNTILLIDDDHDIVLGTQLRLRAAGFETLSAHDGEQGLESARTRSPDAIVLDVRMPKKDGLALLGDLKNNDQTRDIPVVMLSASPVDQAAALDGGAEYFVKKPYNGKELVAAIDSVIKCHQKTTQPPRPHSQRPLRRSEKRSAPIDDSSARC